MERLRERLRVARKAFQSFKEAVAITTPTSIERDAAIQRFEYTVEAVWKTAQRYLEVVEGIEEGSPKGVIRSCREAGLLTKTLAVTALEMIDDRNLTVHTYNETLAEQIHAHLPKYRDLIAGWLKGMEKNLSRLKKS